LAMWLNESFGWHWILLCVVCLMIAAALCQGGCDVEVVSGRSPAVSKIVQCCPELRARFHYPRWAFSTVVQTVFPSFAREFFGPTPATTRTLVVTPDGGTLALEWSLPAKSPTSPIVFVLHGLGGSGRGSQVQLLCRAFSEAGFQSVGVTTRAMDDLPLTSPQITTAVSEEDVEHVVRWLRDHHPEAPLYGVGVSMGGNLLLRYMGRQAAPGPVLGAVAIAPPFQLAKCTPYFEASWFGTLVTKFLQRPLRDTMLRHLNEHPDFAWPESVDKAALERAVRIRDMEDAFVCPLLGLPEHTEYWKAADTWPSLRRIRAPTSILVASDDPIVSPNSHPVEITAESDHLLLIRTRIGGHVGWVEGVGQCMDGSFLPRVVRQLLAATVEVTSSTVPKQGSRLWEQEQRLRMGTVSTGRVGQPSRRS